MVFEKEYIMRCSSAELIECLEMMPSWGRQVNWGKCGIPWANCAVRERRLERTVMRPELLSVKTAQFTQFFRQLWRHTVKSLSLTDSVEHPLKWGTSPCCKYTQPTTYFAIITCSARGLECARHTRCCKQTRLRSFFFLIISYLGTFSLITRHIVAFHGKAPFLLPRTYGYHCLWKSDYQVIR